MKYSQEIKKYAELAVKVGINLQKGEGLIIGTSVHGLPLAREVMKEAYALGAKHVEVMFNDDEMTLARYENGHPEIFESFPSWKVDAIKAMYDDQYHHLFIAASNPELLKDIPGEIVSKDQKTASHAMLPVMPYRMTGKTKWSIVAVPSPSWAKSVFPEQEESEAIDLLWGKIFDATRVSEEDPIQSWRDHDASLAKYKAFLNEKQFEKLTFKAPGTDLEVYLAELHYWMGGSKDSLAGEPFVANIPTEEVFTTPHRLKVNGSLRSTKPLSLNGKLVDGFGFTFKEGKVVDFYAEKGYDVLEKLLETDEGAKYLGEVALVGDDSPISNTGILFNNTLFDENASVHFALGRAYAYAMQNGSELSEEMLLERGANHSLIHVDFMVGGPEMEIIAHEKNGATTVIFEKGNWVF